MVDAEAFVPVRLSKSLHRQVLRMIDNHLRLLDQLAHLNAGCDPVRWNDALRCAQETKLVRQQINDMWEPA